MIIALDGTPLTVPTGGIRRYTLELARALKEQFPENAVHLISDQDGRRLGPLGRRWWSFGIQRELARLGADIFHGTDFTVPYVPLRPSVMTLHDLSPWRDTETDQASARVRHRTPRLLRFGIPTMVITPTDAIRREAISYFNLAGDRVIAVPEAASAEFRPVPVDSSGSAPYLLFVGTVQARKNLDTVVAAWRNLRDRHGIRMIVAGRVRGGASVPDPQPGLELPGEVADNELPALYSGALAVVYPSLYEGFGLPVLEAMQCGAAVIVSEDPALVEVAGDAALRASARDPAAWSAIIEGLLNNPGLLADMRCRAIRRAREFSWNRTASLTRDVYVEAILRF